MAVFRVEKNRGYTVMSNHHLRNPDLTLKAKGLLSQMLSLPENWDYWIVNTFLDNFFKVVLPVLYRGLISQRGMYPVMVIPVYIIP